MISGATVDRGRVRRAGATADLPLFAAPRQSEAAATARDDAMANVTARAERSDVLFLERARKFVLNYLRQVGEASSEEITDAAKKWGIVPPDDRAFGPVYLSLSRRGLIVKAGFCLRKKGHLTSGGNVWRLAK